MTRVSANLKRPDAATAPAKPEIEREADANYANDQQEEGEKSDARKMLNVLQYRG
jgi:hypothetical protein